MTALSASRPDRKVSTALAALGAVFRNRHIALLEGSWTASVCASWTFQVAALVVAYRVAGPVGVGAVGLARMLPSALAAPLVVPLERRFAGRRLLMLIHSFRIALAVLLMAGLIADVSPLALLVVVAVKAAAGVLVRPITLGLVPAIAAAPEELVAANVAASTGEGVGTLVGPVVGGLVVATAGPVAACAVYVAMLAVALVLAALVSVNADAIVPSVAATPLHAVQSGIQALGSRRGARLIVACFFAQVFVRGLLSVLIVVASIELLGLGDSGVGLLNAAIGLGGLCGALATLASADARRLSLPFALALVGWGTPIAIVGLVPVALIAVPVLVVLGASNAILDVSGLTLLQRLIPNAQRTAVLALFEGLVAIGFAIGSVVAPVMLDLLSPRPALLATGAILPLVALVAWRRLARVDDEAVVPVAELTLLRSIPMFSPLPMTVIERLAGEMAAVEFAPGEALVRQGDAADCFYAIESGEVEVVQDGRSIRTIGAGAAVGEIGLLRRVPRTATVRAASATRAYAVRGAAFVAAVTGNPASAAAADGLMNDRLADPAPLGAAES